MNKNIIHDSSVSDEDSSDRRIGKSPENGAAGNGTNGNFDPAGQAVVGEGLFHGSTSHTAFGSSSSASGFGSAAFRPFASTDSNSKEEDSLDWRAIFAMLRRRRKIMLGVFLSVVGLGMLITYLTRPIYNASATLLFSEPAAPSSISSATDSFPLMAELVSSSKASGRATQLALLQGSRTMRGAMEHLQKSDAESVKALQGFFAISADQIGETDLVAVSVQSYSPQAAASFANALCEQFISQNKNQSSEQATKATAYLKNRLGVVRSELDAKRLAYKKFQEVNQTVDPTEEAKARIAQYGDILSSIRQVEANRASDVAELAATRSMTAKMPESQVRPSGITRRTVTEDLKNNLTSLELQRLKTAQEYAPGSDQLRQLDTQIKDIKTRLSTEAKTEIASWSTNLNPIRQNGLQQTAILQARVRSQESRARALNASAREAEAKLKELPDQQYRLGQLMTDLQTLQATYQLLNERYIGMRLREQTSVSNAQFNTPAVPDTQPIRPKKKTNVILSILVGLVLAVAVAAIVDHMDDRVHSQQEAEQASGLSILAQVPFIKDKSKQSLLETGTSSSVLLESYRMLRTNIEFASLGKSLRSITLTSTQPNEGKSTTSTDLAVVMALDGRKVILLDADLRRPTLHTFFDLPNRVGFTNLVAGTFTLEEALHATPIPNLFLLTSGPVPPNPPELLNSKAARAVIAKIGEECDLLIVDTPPALVMADAQIMASMTDGVLLVVSMQEAGKREIARTSQLLTHTGTQVLGAVLNKATAETMGYGSYSNYQKQYYGEYASS